MAETILLRYAGHPQCKAKDMVLPILSNQKSLRDYYCTSRNPYNHNISDAGRRILDWALRQWDKKGRKELT
jgi:hypothetical protein